MPLKETTTLRALEIAGTNVSDLSPLIFSDSFHTLIANHTLISDLSPLTQIPIRTLDIAHTAVSDLAPLALCEGLDELIAENCLITDWSPVAHIETVVGRPIPEP